MRWKLLLAVVFLTIILWVGYVVYAAVGASPTVRASWGYVDEKTTEIWVNANLNRPLMVPVSVDNLTISLSGIPVAQVKRFDYRPTGREVNIAVGIENYNLVRAIVEYLKNGQRGTVSVEFKGRFLGFIPLSLRVSEQISEDVLAYLNFRADSKELAGGLIETPALVETTFEWAGEEDGNIVLMAHMKFYNPNRFPIPVGNLSFDVYANDIKIGYGETEKSVVIPADGYGTLDVRTYIVEDALPKVWVIHVKNGEVSRARADVYLDITALGQKYRVKLASYEETVKTDIMGSINRLLEGMTAG
ncbi:hypothetical protein E3E36_04845 [Thermococcus sp. M36]|uniref:LEA type 2 family protein n=1 Tax=Thermococcus sp. M36 TaxID=1638261 RepID=UPI00143B85DF|nr:LEA type 2 family protein [Thermococcus sp. M36]NJE05479.1 hypothetical protein [Thermococcus sp. M36]